MRIVLAAFLVDTYVTSRLTVDAVLYTGQNRKEIEALIGIENVRPCTDSEIIVKCRDDWTVILAPMWVTKDTFSKTVEVFTEGTFQRFFRLPTAAQGLRKVNQSGHWARFESDARVTVAFKSPAFLVEKISKDDIPPDVMAAVDAAIAHGVSFRYDSRLPGRKLVQINWIPGDPNKLAECIINYVSDPVELNLDGHRYVIQKKMEGETTKGGL